MNYSHRVEIRNTFGSGGALILGPFPGLTSGQLLMLEAHRCPKKPLRSLFNIRYGKTTTVRALRVAALRLRPVQGRTSGSDGSALPLSFAAGPQFLLRPLRGRNSQCRDSTVLGGSPPTALNALCIIMVAWPGWTKPAERSQARLDFQD